MPLWWSSSRSTFARDGDRVDFEDPSRIRQKVGLILSASAIQPSRKVPQMLNAVRDGLLTPDQKAKYDELGYVLVPDFFSPEEIDVIGREAEIELSTPSPRRVFESDGNFVRAVHGSHLEVPFFQQLIGLPRFVSNAEQLLDDQVYIHQFKINAKRALGGERWEWHQDSYFWKHEDGMPSDNAVNFVVHLDEATAANGPLMLVPGSHKKGLLPARIAVDEAAVRGDGTPDWNRTVSAKLKHELDREALAQAMSENGVDVITGPAGSVLLFHPTMLHGSASNMSPFDRRLLILSYNGVSNALATIADPRPEFLASRRFAPVVRAGCDSVAELDRTPELVC